jgi:hypothetical protein
MFLVVLQVCHSQVIIEVRITTFLTRLAVVIIQVTMPAYCGARYILTKGIQKAESQTRN